MKRKVSGMASSQSVSSSSTAGFGRGPPPVGDEDIDGTQLFLNFGHELFEVTDSADIGRYRDDLRPICAQGLESPIQLLPAATVDGEPSTTLGQGARGCQA